MTLLWCDVETSGLNADTDYLLEVGIVVTDDHLDFVDSQCVPIKHPPLSVEELRLSSSVLVQEMHTKSKLWDAINTHGVTVPIAEEILCRFLEKHVEPGESPMCGSTVSFDRGFLRVNMPMLEGFFHYRNIDVSTLKELCGRWNHKAWVDRPTDENKGHRALSDIDHSIAELAYYRRTFLRIT